MGLKISNTRENATWDEAIHEYIDLHVHVTMEKETEDNYRVILSKLVQWAKAQAIDLPDFSARHLRAYIAFRQDTGRLKQSTIRADVFRAKAFLKWLYKEDLIAKDPLADYAIPRGEQPYVPTPSIEEIRRLLSSVKERFDPHRNRKIINLPAKRRRFLCPRNYAVLAVLIETGCRSGECSRLRLDDFDPAQSQMAIRSTKTDKPRIVPVMASIAAVDDWLRVRPARELKQRGVDNLFVNEYGERLTTDAIRDILSDQLAYANIPAYTVHSLRHYSITEIAKVNLEVARKIAGHTSIETTMGYLNMTADTVRAVHGEAGPLSKAIMVNKRTETNRRRRITG